MFVEISATFVYAMDLKLKFKKYSARASVINKKVQCAEVGI